MKISSSTSLLFATLAISSSSTSLAAPAGEPSQSEARMTSSPSDHHVTARQDPSAGRSLRPSNMQQAMDMARSIDNEGRGLLDLLGPLLCPITSALLTCPAKSASGKQSMLEADSGTCDVQRGGYGETPKCNGRSQRARRHFQLSVYSKTRRRRFEQRRSQWRFYLAQRRFYSASYRRR
ncbi:hypothetical protein C8R44DRAFT_265045 [Mycena epipterygia]|nr:hypothetical protein C8R44DRAFT_265045 [Mycena epipterygia]